MRAHVPTPVLATLLLALLAAGCSRGPDAPAPAASAPGTAPASAVTTAPAPATSATAGSRVEALAPDAIAYFGLARAPFGSDEKMLRAAWPGELATQGPQQADGCYSLYPRDQAQAPGRRGIGFMFERGRFARIDVDDPAMVAPGGGRIGMDRQQIAALYPQRMTVQPHKYVDGAQYLRVPDAGSSGQVLVFETGTDARVTRWRIGTTPQVDYVEGCG